MQNAVAPPNDASPFDIELSVNGEQKTILTNVEDAIAVYTFNLTATDLFSAMFVQALSHLLASQIAFSLTGKRKIQTDQFNFYQNVLRAAMASNANEQVSSAPRDADWIRARSGIGSSGVGADSLTSFPDGDN